jgi:multicomponent Na+:H+ antiporter subunit B
MRSLILRKVAEGVLPVTTLFAVYLLLRGHDEPGGGFIAGLVTASALVLQGLAFGAAFTRRKLYRYLRPITWLGLLIAVGAGLIPVLFGDPFLMHYHGYLPWPGGQGVHLSTTLIFDIGVYLVVVGISAIVLSVFSEAGT